MTDRAEGIETLSSTPRAPNGIFGSQMILGGLIGAAIATLVSRITQRQSEEPPIRVKRGSTEFEILDPNIIWMPVGNSRRKWRLSNGVKGSDWYKVVIQLKGSTEHREGRLTRIHLNERTWIDLRSNQRRTTLTSPQYDLQVSDDHRTLTHPLNIDRIQVDARVPYYEADGELIEVLIYDA